MSNSEVVSSKQYFKPGMPSLNCREARARVASGCNQVWCDFRALDVEEALALRNWLNTVLPDETAADERCQCGSRIEAVLICHNCGFDAVPAVEPAARQLTDAENAAMDRDIMKAIKRDAEPKTQPISEINRVLRCLEHRPGEDYQVQVIAGESESFWIALADAFCAKRAKETERQLSPSEAASFDKTLARSPRVKSPGVRIETITHEDGSKTEMHMLGDLLPDEPAKAAAPTDCDCGTFCHASRGGQVLPLGARCRRTSEKASEPQMAMLPNDRHPGPGCSCRDCLRQWPDVHGYHG